MRQRPELDPPDLGKTEAWLILDALPGARVYAGLVPGLRSRQRWPARIAAGRTEQCLHCFEPRAGDCLFIPAGTVHALGGRFARGRNPAGERYDLSPVRLEPRRPRR